DGKTKCPTQSYDIDFSITAPKLPNFYIIEASIFRPNKSLTVACGYTPYMTR
ncbi:25357_t:CDS:1, partial [Dentiscutata erythropus]